MAKQLVNPVERHVEKGVLGLAGLALIWAVVSFLVSSPNQLTVGGESVTPSTIDLKVAQKATSVRDRTRRATVELELPRKLYPRFERSLNPFASAKIAVDLPAVAPIGPEVPIIDPPEVVEGNSSLVKVVPPSPPVLIHGRSTFTIDERATPLNWVTVSVMFDVKKQMEEQGREYGASRKEVLFGPVQLQRRARRDDGSWSDEDWQFVEAWPSVAPPPAPSITLEQEGSRLVVPRASLVAVDQFFTKLRDPALQLGLIRPLMPPDFVNGDVWRLPVITNERDVLVQDDYYLNPDKPPAADPLNRYVPEEERTGTPEKQRTPQEIMAQAQTLYDSAWKNKSLEQITEAFNLATDVADNESLSRSIRNKAADFRDRVEQRESDIKRWIARNGGASVTSATEEKVEREPPSTEQLWVHDAKPGSVKSGMTYQYRLRVLLFNRLAGQPDKFRNKADATTMFIPGEWTDPVPITIEPDTVFFVNSQDDRKKKIGVEFYRWFEGVWVQSSRFKYGVGDPVTGSSRCEVPSYSGDTPFDRTTVDFAANVTVVDIDFKRPFRERKRGKGRGGVRFAPLKPACSVVFADASGRLHERFVLADKANPEKRMYRERKYKPPKEK